MTQVVPNLTLCQQRAQGMPGARCARSLVCEMKKHTSVVTTVTPETPGTPRAMVLTAYSALSPVTGLSCHRRARIISANLTPASGRLVPAFRSSCTLAAPPFTNFGKQRALANSKNSSVAFDLTFLVRTRGKLCRNFKSATLAPHDFAVRLKRYSSKALQRPPHPAPNVRDDRETPL